MADENNKPNKENEDEALGEGGIKALRAERKTAAAEKARADAAEKELEELRAQQLSKEEAALKRAEKAEQEAAKLREKETLRAIKEKVSETTGIPIKLLHGSDEAEVKESAAAAKEYTESLTGPRRPAPDPNLGNNDGKTSDDADAEALAALGFGELS